MISSAAGVPAFDSIPVGESRTLERVYPARSAPQRRFVGSVVALPSFAFACDNPFSQDQLAHSYRGPFWFLWYDTAGRLHAMKIGALGRLLLPEIIGSSSAPPARDRDPMSDELMF